MTKRKKVRALGVHFMILILTNRLVHSHAVTLLASQCFNWFQIFCHFLWIFLTFLILALVSDVFRIEIDNYGEEQNTDSALNQRLEEADC